MVQRIVLLTARSVRVWKRKPDRSQPANGGVANYDFSVVKRTQITERVGLDFNAEFFNIFNRVQFRPAGSI